MSQPARQATDGAEAKEDEEEEEQDLLPMRAAPGPAGPSGAVGQQPSAPAATGAFPWYSGSERCEARRRAVPVSPGVKAEHASNAVAGAVKPDTAPMSTRKRKHEHPLLHEGAFTAARPASVTGPAAAGGAASSHAAHGLPASPPGSDQGSKMPSPTMQSSASRRYVHTQGPDDSPTLISPTSSSLPIILSDSEDEKRSPNPKPTPHLRFLHIPTFDKPMPSPRQTPTPTPRTRNPPGFSSKGPSAAVGFSQGSADSSFVIVLSDSDDSSPPSAERAGEALAGSMKSKPSPNSQHQMTRHSTATDSRRLEGTGCPLVFNALPQAVPFNLKTKGVGFPSASNALPRAVPFNMKMKGSNAPSPSSLITNHSPVEKLPASKHTPSGGSTERSLTLAHTSSPAACAAELQESVRQTARSCALISLPRRPKSACNPSSHPSSEPLSNSSGDPSTSPSSDTITASAGELFFPSSVPCLVGCVRASGQKYKWCDICVMKSAVIHLDGSVRGGRGMTM